VSTSSCSAAVTKRVARAFASASRVRADAILLASGDEDAKPLDSTRTPGRNILRVRNAA
jgi:hypothetical protein